MTNQITYTSQPQLRTPRVFWSEFVSDLKATKSLGWRLFLTDMRSQVRQSWLGYFWLLVPPLITSLIWIFLSRSKVINTNTPDSVYPIFVISGIFIWQTFVETLNMPIHKLLSQKAILTKVKVPHEAFILAGLGGIVFNLSIRMALLLALLPIFGTGFNIALLFVPFGLLTVLLLGLAIGLFFTPLGMLYTDVPNALNAGFSLLFFLTPIIYQIPNETGLWQFLRYNPVTPLLSTTRDWIISGSAFPEPAFYFVACAALALLAFSWILYRLAKPHLLSRI
jgi:lipopolysaccharide transport system permease protein